MNTMKKAHEIRRAAAIKFNCKASEIHFGECLRLAHNDEDDEMKKEDIIEQAIKAGEEYLAGTDCANTPGFDTEFWHSTVISLWEKYGMSRIYINMKYGRSKNGKNYWKRGVSYFVDTKTGKIKDSSREYNNARQRKVVKETAEAISSLLTV